MFSGKSSELVRRVRRHSLQQREPVVKLSQPAFALLFVMAPYASSFWMLIAFAAASCSATLRFSLILVRGPRVLMIKYCFDNRYTNEDKMSTHDKVMMDACSAGRLDAVVANAATAQKYADAEVVGIDEGQFFPDLIEFCERAANEGKIVIVSALDGTFERKPFGRILDLVPLAESVDKLKAVCTVCYADAAFTFRKSAETAVEIIGGAEMYVPLCRSCFSACRATQKCELEAEEAESAAAEKATQTTAAAAPPRCPSPCCNEAAAEQAEAETQTTTPQKKKQHAVGTKIEAGLEGICPTPGEPNDLLG